MYLDVGFLDYGLAKVESVLRKHDVQTAAPDIIFMNFVMCVIVFA